MELYYSSAKIRNNWLLCKHFTDYFFTVNDIDAHCHSLFLQLLNKVI